MRTVKSTWLLLSLLFLSHMIMAEETRAQVGPSATTAEEFQIRNQSGQEVGLTLPAAGVSPYSVLFPTTAPGTGDLFFSTNGSGQMSWLTPGADGSLLTISGGLPVWQNPNGLFWGLTGNSGTNPVTNFIGTTDAQPLLISTNSVERIRVQAAGRVGVGSVTSNPQATLHVGSIINDEVPRILGGNDYSVDGNVAEKHLFSSETWVTVPGVVGVAMTGSTPDIASLGTFGSVGVVGSPNGNTGGRMNVGLYGHGHLQGVLSGNSGNSGVGGYMRARITSAVSDFNGTLMGVRAEAYSTDGTSATSGGSPSADGGALYGVYSTAEGNPTDTTFGGYFSATGATTNFGVYSEAGTNYFANSVGVGTTEPTTPLHVFAANDPLRLEGLATDNTLDNLLVADATGVVHQRDISSITNSFWSLTGNTGTNSATNFLGTTDAQDLVVRTNNSTAITVDGTTQDVSIASNAVVDGNTTLGDDATADAVTVNAVITANGQGNTIGDNTANQQLTVDGVVDAVIGNTLVGEPTVWDAVVDGDLITTGIIKSGGSLWIDGVTPGNHQIVADDQLGVGTTTASALVLSTNSVVAVSIDGTSQLMNVGSGLNLRGAASPLLADGLPGTAGEVLVTGGPGNTPNWGRVDASSLNLSENAMFVGNASNVASELAAGNDADILAISGSTPTWTSLNSVAWGLTGNSGTNQAVNFLGTTDAQNLAFRTNNLLQMQLTTDGDLFLGQPGDATRSVGFGNIESSIGHVSQGGESNMYVRARANLYMLADANNNSADNVTNDNLFHWGINATDRDSTSYSELMTLTGLGRLGIGTSDPQDLLHVSGGDIRLDAPVSGGPQARSVEFGGSGDHGMTNVYNGSGSYLYLKSRANMYMIADANRTDPSNAGLIDNTFQWGINAINVDSTNYIPLMTLTGLGRLGIGQTNPQNQLHIAGGTDPVRLEGMATDNTLTEVVVADGTGVLHTRDVSSLTDNFWGLAGNAGTSPATNFVGTTDAQDLVLRTNNLERARISAAGHFTVTNSATVNNSFDVGGDASIGGNARVGGDVNVNGNTTLGNSAVADVVTVNAVVTANGQGNTVGNNSANQQLTIDGVADAVIGNTLAANPTVWDAVVDGDLVATGVIKSGGSVWVDGVTPGNHKIVANVLFSIGTTNGNNLRLRTNNVTGLVVSGSNQRVNILSSLNLSGASVVLLANGTAGSAGNVFVSGGAGTTPSWSNPNDLFWELGGNSITDPTTQYLGTTNNQPLAVRTNSVERMRVESDGDVAIGATTAPNSRLRVGGGDIGLDQGRRIVFDPDGAQIAGMLRNQFELVSNGGQDMEFASRGGMHFLTDFNNTGSSGEDFVWAKGDVAPGDANYVELMRLTRFGRLGLGTDNPGGVITVINDDNSNVADDVIIRTHSDTYTPLIRLVRSRGTSLASQTHLLNNDIIGHLTLHSGLSTVGGEIRAVADANHSATDFSTRLEFRTTSGTTAATQMTIDDNGSVGIGIQAPTQTLHVVGNAGKTVGGTTWVNLSDERTKDIQGAYQKGLSDILDLRPVVFRYKADNPWGAASDVDQYGYIAQEVETVFPEAVETGDDGYLVFNMHPILVAYTNAVKELNTKNEELEKTVEDLTTRLEALEAAQKASIDTTAKSQSVD